MGLDVRHRLQIPRQPIKKQDPQTRVHNWDEVFLGFDIEAAKVEAARSLIYRAATAVDLNDTDSINRLAAMSKSFATDVAMEVTTDAVQIFGGYGYMKDYPIEKYMRDAKITQIYEGTNQIQRLVIARNLIKDASRFAHIDAYIPKESYNEYHAVPEAELTAGSEPVAEGRARA